MSPDFAEDVIPTSWSKRYGSASPEHTMTTKFSDVKVPPVLAEATCGWYEARRRWERAFGNVVCEAYVLGVSTRKVEDLIERMGAKGVSKSTVSRMAEELDEQVAAFRSRPLDKPFPYVWLDATYIKVREANRVVS